MLGKPARTRDVGILLPRKSKSKKVSRGCRKRRQAGIQGWWQHESPAREYLVQVKCCNDTDCTPRIMKQALIALKGGSCEEYKSIFRTQVKATEWASDRMKEASVKLAKDEARKLSTVQEIMVRSTDCLRRIIASAGRQGGATMSYLCPHCNSFPMEDYVWWVSGEKQHTNWWCAICGENITGGNQTDTWWCSQAKVLIRPRS